MSADTTFTGATGAQIAAWILDGTFALPAILPSTDFKITNADTNTVVYPVSIIHNSSGAIANDFGVGMDLYGQTDTTPDVLMAQIQAEWIVSAHTSRQSRIKLKTLDVSGLVDSLIVNFNGAIFDAQSGQTPATFRGWNATRMAMVFQSYASSGNASYDSLTLEMALTPGTVSGPGHAAISLSDASDYRPLMIGAPYGSVGIGYPDGSYVAPSAAFHVAPRWDQIITIIQATTSQTLDLMQWTDHSLGVLAKINAGGVFFPLQKVTASAPTYVKGGIYFDTTLNKLCVGGASAWETITST